MGAWLLYLGIDACHWRGGIFSYVFIPFQYGDDLLGIGPFLLSQDTLRETHDEEAGFDPETSSIYRMMTMAMGERLVPHYGDGALAT